METTKETKDYQHVFVDIEIQNGETRYNSFSLHVFGPDLKIRDIKKAIGHYNKEFYGDPKAEVGNDGWIEHFEGTIATRVKRWEFISPSIYEILRRYIT